MIHAVFTNMTTLIANRIRNIERKIGTSGLNCILHKNFVLFFCKMFIKICVECTTAIKILCKLFSVKNELIYYICSFVLYNIEVTVIAVARNEVSIFSIPLGVLDTKIFSPSVTLMTNLFYQSALIASSPLLNLILNCSIISGLFLKNVLYLVVLKLISVSYKTIYSK